MKDCIFCQIVKEEQKSWKVFENDRVVAFFDYNPVNEYHTLVIPKKHYENIFDTPIKELNEVMSAIKQITTIYNKKLGIKNLQIISSSGSEAQQDVFHIHFHIVPRKNNDNQNINWTPQTGIRDIFDELLEKLK